MKNLVLFLYCSYRSSDYSIEDSQRKDLEDSSTDASEPENKASHIYNENCIQQTREEVNQGEIFP